MYLLTHGPCHSATAHSLIFLLHSKYKKNCFPSLLPGQRLSSIQLSGSTNADTPKKVLARTNAPRSSANASGLLHPHKEIRSSNDPIKRPTNPEPSL